MSLRTAYRVDAPSLCLPVLDAAGRKLGDAEIALRTNPNNGALEFIAPLTWTGVRRYRHADGSVTRELRRPEQVRSESHQRGLRLLTATADHPSLPDGTPVYLDARGGPGVLSPDGSALRPARDFEVGHVGDTITDGEIDGYYVPLGRVAITDLATQRKIAGGRTQTSLGYSALLDDTGGAWTGPNGPEEYDIEHVLDHEDDRVKQAIADGVLATVERLVDGKIVQVPVLGPNHFATAIWAGRGDLQSEIIDFLVPAATAPTPRADAADGQGAHAGFAVVVADAAPVAQDAAIQRAARSARLDSLSVVRLDPALAAYLCTAPLSGYYSSAGACECGSALPAWGTECPVCRERLACGEWLGWIVPGDGCPGCGGLAFIATDGLGLWWSQRAPDGGVYGDPVAFAWRGPPCQTESGEEEESQTIEIRITENECEHIEDAMTEHAARQQNPAKFDKFLRFAMPNAASLILGRKGDGPWQVQSVRFPVDEWKVGAAKKWLSAIGLSASNFEIAPQTDSADGDAEPTITEDSPVSLVAPENGATYAHDVRGDAADARLPTMRKIYLPARFADTAGALATAVKAPAPVSTKVGDAAMLEVELPEGSDPVMLAAGMHALASAIEKMGAALGSAEGKVEELGADYATAMEALDAAKTKVDALEADAEVGRAHRLSEVIAIAKKVGLTDSDVAGKNADQVRTAAVSHKYASLNMKHLDHKLVLDNMWLALKNAVDAQAVAPVVVVPVPEPKPELRPEPKPRTDSQGSVADAPKPKTTKLSVHAYG